MLVVAAMNLDQHMKSDALGTTSLELLVQAKNHLDEASAAARLLSFELHPPLLQRSGLPAALNWLSGWTRNKYGLEVHVSADPHANSSRKDVRTLLFESVRELLFNVVKHAQVDRVEVDLRIDANDMLCITVADQGIGFDPAALVDRAKAGVVGWGLFSIRERLTLLGGRLEIDSAPGQGTRFRLLAPRGVRQTAVDEEQPGHVSVRPPARGTAHHASAHALRILIVDDQASARTSLHRMLQERPELVVVGDASDGFEAIALAHALRPDVVLMDISMPRMDGIEATRRLRAELPLIQVLGLSMQSRTQGSHEIEHAGAAGFFTKGVDSERLIDYLLGMHATTMPGLSRSRRRQ
jgi:CheY-like chemotaxis protein